ncbi:tetratricopeptide repeat protein [Sandarakinorhabdus sp.]|uniref:O-linked N-acetylglucosamine transferase, SPINDLY family protein n=1 Tax=Sandarakinorhabdus sp. TaxID=1916663 RepID=UPI00333F851B
MRDDAARLNSVGQQRALAGDAAGALAAFAGAAALAPDDADAVANHALALLRAGDPLAAIARAEAALALAPDHAVAAANLGHALLAAGQAQAAADRFAAVLARHPGHADALVGMAMAQRTMGRIGSALVAIDRAVALAPGSESALGNRGILLLDAADPAGAIAAAIAAAGVAPASLGHAMNAFMAMSYDIALDPMVAAQATCDWGARLTAGTPRLPLPPRPPGRPLRVGYLSADLCRHPVAWLGARAMLHHDPDRLMPLVYATAHSDDDVARAFRSGVALWRDCTSLADADIARQIAADRIDILVDLAGHTAGGRPGVLAMQPAPRIVSWLGHVATTGLPTVAAVLMDEWHAPPGSEALFAEKLLRLPGGRFAYTPPAEAPEPARQPGGPVTFGCFQALAKLNPDVASLWVQAMDHVPGSRLLIKRRGLADPWLRGRITAMFAEAGLDPVRLVLEPESNHARLLADYGRIDVALDPFPFCGGASTAEALWMGVPVVTLPGRAPGSRQSCAMLSAIGETATVAASPDDHAAAVQRALALGDSRKQRRERLAASPLGSTVRLAAALDAALIGLADGG